MKILMVVRSNLYSSPGGDTVQIDMTAKYLRFLNVDVHIITASTVIKRIDYDLIHFFNIIRPDDVLPFIKNLSIPYVVSTIFVDYSEYERNNRNGLAGLVFKILSSGQIEFLKAIARRIVNGDKIKSTYYLLHGHNASMKYVAIKSAMLLPNSHSEYNRLANYLKIEHPYQKVVNAINKDIFAENVLPNEEYTNHVLCVGRIEGRKNQLNLIKALVGTELKLTIIGKPSPNHLNYYIECKRVAQQGNNVQFISHIEHPELVKIYKAAKVHVLPSWFETTGLSTLEAGVMGCNIVVTKKGDTEEYFRDFAYYCDPDNVSSIRERVFNAYEDEVNPELKDFILNNYTWEKTAAQTLAAYKSVLNS